MVWIEQLMSTGKAIVNRNECFEIELLASIRPSYNLLQSHAQKEIQTMNVLSPLHAGSLSSVDLVRARHGALVDFRGWVDDGVTLRTVRHGACHAEDGEAKNSDDDLAE